MRRQLYLILFTQIFMLRLFLILIIAFKAHISFTQDKPIISGALETNANVFLRDSSINAINTPQYDRQFFGGEAWLNINVQYEGFTFGTRFDAFNNSNLQNPNDSYSGTGIGRWYIKKRIDKLELSAGYLYDQIGSGVIFRAFENRPLFIDNALYGVQGKYDFNDSWNLMAFVGKQKNALEVHTGNLKGIRLEGFINAGSEENPINFAPGIGFVNRTISDENMLKVKDELRTYQTVDRFSPKLNTYSASLYNTFSYKGISLYTEAALKSNDIFNNPFAVKTELVGTTLGKLQQNSGSVFYGSMSFTAGKLGVTLDAKRTENFSFRVDPTLELLRGIINFLQPLNRQNTYRLTARYSPAAQEISEMAYAADIRYAISKNLSANVNFSDIKTLDGMRLFQELFTEIIYKHKRKWQILTGIQFLTYNQEVFEMKAEVPLVKTIVPYADFLYKFSRKKALRLEFQYMDTEQDFGSWIFGAAEYTIAPRWNFEFSGMFNNQPKKANSRGEIEKIFYPTAGMAFVNNAQRYSLRYVKQVEGVVCSGGICRLEPAFSGFRFSLNTTF